MPKGGGVPSNRYLPRQSGQSKPSLYLNTCLTAVQKIGVSKTTSAKNSRCLGGEQTVLCGGAVELVKMGFRPLTETGYAQKWPI